MRISINPGICILLLILFCIAGAAGDGTDFSQVKPDYGVPITGGETAFKASEVQEAILTGAEHGYMLLDDTMAIRFAEVYNEDTESALNVASASDFTAASLPTSVDLSAHVPYSSSNIAQRNQGYCGNCWAWAATGVIEVERSVQSGTKSQLSVQYLNSNYNGGSGSGFACCGGFAEDFVTFYNGAGDDRFIPWSNTGGSYADGTRSCGSSTARSASQITTTPNYPFNSLQTQQITTTGVSRLTAINNIKSVLNQNKAVWIAFYWYDNYADFSHAWSQGASYEYNPVTGVGSSGSFGGHAMTIIGYEDPNNDGTGYWIVLNSWGNRNNDPYLPGTIRFEMNTDYSALVPGYESYNLPVSMYYIYNVAFTSTGDPAPTVTSITPATGANTGTVSITSLAGTNFQSGAAVKLTRTGYTDITATAVSVVSSTRITCTFDLTGKAAGTWNVVVTNSDGQSGTKTGAFTITGSTAPTVTSITPATGANTGTVSITSLAGTNFQSGAAVKLTRTGYSDIAATAVSVVSSTRITCTLDLTGKAAGAWDVVVTNSDGQTGTKTGAFTITGSTAPTVTSITPATGANTGIVSITSLAGTNFQSGAAVKLTRTGYTDITATAVSVVSSTRITCTLDLTGKAAGAWDVVVTNSDGQNGTKAGAFTITEEGGSPSDEYHESGFLAYGQKKSYGPYPVPAGTGIVSIILDGPAGQDFDLYVARGRIPTTTSWDYRPYEYDADEEVIISNPTSGDYYAMIHAFSGSGSYTLDVLMSGGSEEPTPTVTGITPGSGANTGTVSITNLAGTNFQNGATVRLIRAGESEILGSGVSVVSSTKITCTFDLTGKTAGTWDVVVTNPDGRSGTLPDGFTVTTSGLSITSITPSTGSNTGNQAVTIAGTNFRAGAFVTLSNGVATKTVTLTTVTATQVKCTLPLKGMPTGLYNVTVKNRDQTAVTAVNAFTVTSPPPVLSAVKPVTGYNTRPIQLTITGNNFNTGAAVEIAREGTTIPGTVTSLLSSKIIVTCDISDVPTGQYTLTVTNPDGLSATRSNAFTVLAPGPSPVITSITPATGMNTGNTAIVITGENFRSKATVTIANAIVTRTVPKPSVTATRMTCTLPLKGMPAGLYNITVTNTDGTTAMEKDVFTITNPTPVLSSIKPLAGYNTGPVPVIIYGKNFATGLAMELVSGGTTIPGTVTSVSSTRIIGSFDLSGVPGGQYTLTVTNTGATPATRSNAFTVREAGPAPTITGIAPGLGFSTANLKVAITGTNFNKPTVTLRQGELTKTAVATAGRPSTSSILYVTLPLRGVPGGMYDITVTNIDGTSVTAESLVSVTGTTMAQGGHLAPDSYAGEVQSGGIVEGGQGGTSGMVQPDTAVVL